MLIHWMGILENNDLTNKTAAVSAHKNNYYKTIANTQIYKYH